MKKTINALLLAVSIILLDQLSKYYAMDWLIEAGAPIRLTSFLNLVLVFNQGISFGLLSQQDAGLFLIITTSLLVVALLIWLWRSQERWQQLALSMIIGGAIGNIIDRVRIGAVIDFVDIHLAGYHWPAFNLADSMIVIGVGILMWLNIRADEKTDKQEEKGEA